MGEWESIDWRSLGAVDAAALAVLAVAVVRGLWIGVIRESFSLASIAAACLAVRFATAPAAALLLEHGPAGLAPLPARIGAAVGVALGTVIAVRLAGRILRSGVHAVGLGLADRLAGGLLGAAEGALVLALALLLGLTALGREHAVLAGSRAVRALDETRAWAGLAPDEARPHVAAPPPGRR